MFKIYALLNNYENGCCHLETRLFRSMDFWTSLPYVNYWDCFVSQGRIHISWYPWSPPAETCGIKALCFHSETLIMGPWVMSYLMPHQQSTVDVSLVERVIPPYFLAWRIFMSRVSWWFLYKSASTSSHNFINCSYLEWCLIGSRIVKVATVQLIYRAGQITNLLPTNSDPSCPNGTFLTIPLAHMQLACHGRSSIYIHITCIV